jgi:F-type H+-transporting ATPase subunit a
VSSPFVEAALFHVGPVPVAGSTVTSFAITAALALGSLLATRRMSTHPGLFQTTVETIVVGIEDQVRDITRRDPRPFLPLVGTLFLFLLVANALDVVPFLHSPTARLETTLALGIIVFFSVHYYGIRSLGVVGYLKHFAKPNPLLAPINVLSEMTRTLSLMMRLLGNIMSHGLVLAVIVSLAGLIVPVPIMAFGLLIAVVQAYIFSTLATVYVGAAIDPEASS